MAQFQTQYYTGEDQYSDGDAEERILEIVQKKKSLEASGDRSFPVLYHLSPVRENILSWYDFSPGASALEIGAGPGAITGLLCRKLKSVTSVELSMRRAKINYERHKEYDNLTIMAGNLNDMQFPEPFDYVILNGVFEYAGSFTPGADPYGTFLKRCAGYLKAGGLLLIAIENRLGLKYFAGAPEDHTENYMEGLKDYPENDAVHTFSKREWEDMLDRCGLSYRRFYYPYPDYKFPNEIFTEKTLRADGFGRNAWNFNPKRLELFSEQAMGESLIKEGVMASFMNSFLIEAGVKAAGASQASGRVIYAKINSDRSPMFRIQTVICEDADGSRKVAKRPLTEEAKAHLKRMHEREMQQAAPDKIPHRAGGRDMVLLAGDVQADGSVVYPYLNRQNRAQMIRPEASSIREACAALYGQIRSKGVTDREEPEAFAKLFGGTRMDSRREALEYVSPANIDLIFDNVFPAGDHDDVIDGEWITDTPVPALFLLWRAVNELYSSRRELERVLPQAQLLKEYGIDASDRQVFWKWATHFEKEYVKANRLAEYAVPVRKADLKDLQWFGEDVRLTASLYMDRGNGFREEDALHADVVIGHGRYDVSFEIEYPETVRALRFDPLEGCACICHLACAQGRLLAMNASAKMGERDVFLTPDPAYRVKVSAIPKQLRITGQIRTKDIRWALEKSQALLHRKRLSSAGKLAGRIIRKLCD